MTKAVFLALIMLAPVAAYGQSRIGIFGGYSTVSTVADLGDPTGSLHPRSGETGFTPGVAATVQLPGKLALTAELMTVRKGFARTYEPNDGLLAYDLHIRYVEFPVLLGARYPLHHGFSLQVQGGVTLSARVQCSEMFTNPDSSSTQSDCVHTGHGGVVPATDVSATAGFGVVWHRLWLVGNYEFTGRDIAANSPGLGLQERTLTLMAGFDIILGKDQPSPPPYH